MPDPSLARATAGQLRRAGFAIEPERTPDDATTGFDVVTHHADEKSRGEHERAKERGDAFPGRRPETPGPPAS